MANRGKGTVITTHKATYIPANLNPGYSGFLPDLRHQYGETYGRSTTRHFFTERARAVSLIPKHASTKETYKPIIRRKSAPGIPPCLSAENSFDSTVPPGTSNSNIFAKNSHILASSLNRSRIYQLDDLMAKCQDHRRSYKDLTGCTPYVKYFVVPENFGDKYVGKRYKSFCDFHGIVMDKDNGKADKMGLNADSLANYYRSSNRERAMRDLHFEKR